MTKTRRHSGPDPASPWMINTRELGRRPGEMRRYQRRIPAPSGFGLEVIRIPPGAPIELDARLESVAEGVFVSGHAGAELTGECARCLEPIEDTLTVDVMELFAYPGSATDESTEPDEISRVVDEMVDLEQMVRDAVLLALPLAPLCRPECQGLCPDCGDRWAELSPEHSHETLDPRWAALRERLASATDAGVDERR